MSFMAAIYVSWAKVGRMSRARKPFYNTIYTGESRGNSLVKSLPAQLLAGVH